MGTRLGALSLCVAVVLTVLLPAAAVETLWTHKLDNGYVPGSPGIGDVDGDGRVEIVVTTTLGSIIALNADAQEVWRYETGTLITLTPTVIDVDGDGTLEVLALTDAGTVWCLAGRTGEPIWDDALPGASRWGQSGLAVGDLDNDGTQEIVTGDELGSVVCLAADGTVVWTYQGPHGHSLCPALGDLDGDGMLEVVVGGTARPLVCVSHKGEERWVRHDPLRGASPVVWDVNGDGQPEIIAAIDDQLALFDGRGNVLWTLGMKATIDAAISVADVDKDGVVEIYAVDLFGHLVCVAPDGNLRWSGDVVERARRSPSVADVDGDGAMEILVASYSGSMDVFDLDGALQERISLGGRSNATPTVVDLMGDGRPCVVCPNESGGMPAFRWPESKPGAEVAWAEYRYNAARTAAQVAADAKPLMRIAAMSFGDFYAGYNPFTVRVENPAERELTVCLEVTLNGGAPSKRTRVSSSPSIDVGLDYALAGGDVANLVFTCTLYDGDRQLKSQSHTTYVEPFQKAMADVANRCATLDGLVARLPDASGMAERACFLAAKLPACRERVARAATMPQSERRALRKDLTALLEESARLANTLEGAVAAMEDQAGPVVIAAANPWAPFGGMAEIEEGRVGPSEMVVEAFNGEVESAALNVFNLSAQHRTVRVVVDALKRTGDETAVPAKQAITLREAVAVGTQVGDQSADALPKLNEGSLIVAPGWDARQLWFTIDTAQLGPGEWTADVRLSSLDVEPLEMATTLKVTVWHAALPEEQTLRSCQWGYVHSSRLKDQPEAALEDQVAHGTNVFVSTIHPRATFDENGDLVGEIDFAAHDDYVRRHAPHGIILFCGYQGAMSCPGGQDSPAYRKAHVAWLRDWVKHLAELGVGYDGWALYPVDEPGLAKGLVERNIHFGELAREADPNILLYTDPVSGITMEELERLAPYVDIWCPHRHMYVYADGDEAQECERRQKMFAFIKSTGSTVWTYECQDDAKHRSPLGYYRGQAWLAWHHGLTGIGYWSYCTSADDPWFKPKASLDYLLIYQGNGVVPSKRWEAVRDGIEDHSMLAVLRDAVKAAEAGGKSAEAVAEAKRLLGPDASAIAEFCDQYGREDNPSQERGPILRPVADMRWARLQDTRRQIAELLSTLKGE
jgi:outer membrane protein assembly factor BamB